MRRFRIGYAPGGGAVLAGRAIREGFSREALVDAGLARMRGGRAWDFFVSRITFPIADSQGRVQGFGGRTLDPRERAKYVNSPEGDHFKRSLCSSASPRPAGRPPGRSTSSWPRATPMSWAWWRPASSRPSPAWAPLTTDQLKLLRRWAPEIRLCFDADAAGEQAAWRTVEAARGPQRRAVGRHAAPGRDPGDLAGDEEGRGGWRAPSTIQRLW